MSDVESILQQYPHLEAGVRRARAQRLLVEQTSLLRSLVEVGVRRGMSVDEIAALLGVTPEVVARFEQDGADPTLTFVAQYANAVGAELTFSVQLGTVPNTVPGDSAPFDASGGEVPEESVASSLAAVAQQLSDRMLELEAASTAVTSVLSLSDDTVGDMQHIGMEVVEAQLEAELGVLEEHLARIEEALDNEPDTDVEEW